MIRYGSHGYPYPPVRHDTVRSTVTAIQSNGDCTLMTPPTPRRYTSLFVNFSSAKAANVEQARARRNPTDASISGSTCATVSVSTCLRYLADFTNAGAIAADGNNSCHKQQHVNATRRKSCGRTTVLWLMGRRLVGGTKGIEKAILLRGVADVCRKNSIRAELPLQGVHEVFQEHFASLLCPHRRMHTQFHAHAHAAANKCESDLTTPQM
jgi:hypothetical protein